MLDLINRFKEPSSWAGIATGIVTVLGIFSISPPADMTTWIATGGALIASVLAFFLSENKGA